MIVLNERLETMVYSSKYYNIPLLYYDSPIRTSVLLSLYTCMYVFMYVCIYVCMCLFVYISTYIFDVQVTILCCIQMLMCCGNDKSGKKNQVSVIISMDISMRKSMSVHIDVDGICYV